MNSVVIRRDICFIIDFSLELIGRIIRVTETVFMLQIVGNADILILKHYESLRNTIVNTSDHEWREWSVIHN